MNFITKTRFLVAVIVIQAALIVSIFATLGYKYYSLNRKGEEPKNLKRNKPSQPDEFIKKSLQLTPEQCDKFRANKSDFRRTYDSLEFQSKNISKLLTEEVIKDAPNQKVLDSLINAFGEIQKLQKHAMAEHLIGIKQICTPQQQQQFKKFVLRMQDYRQKQHRNMHHNKETRQSINNN